MLMILWKTFLQILYSTKIVQVSKWKHDNQFTTMTIVEKLNRKFLFCICEFLADVTSNVLFWFCTETAYFNTLHLFWYFMCHHLMWVLVHLHGRVSILKASTRITRMWHAKKNSFTTFNVVFLHIVPAY